MDPNTQPAPLSDLEVMNARLTEMEAAQAAAPDGADVVAPKPDDSATNSGNRAPEAGEPDGTAPDNLSTDTPSTADKTGDKGTADKTAPKPDAGQPPVKGSKYAQDKERQDRSWKTLNDQKEAFKVEKAKFDSELKAHREQLAADRSEFEDQKAQARQSETPEAYETWSKNESAKAKALEKQAIEAEADGQFERADQLREARDVAKAMERLAKEKAEDIRKNPAPTDEKRDQTRAAEMKEWTLKAATDFADFAKKDSPVQAEAVKFLQYMGKNFPRLANVPQLVYFAAERAVLKSAADRVPGLEKELGVLRTKVTELEALTNPTPSGGAQQLPGDKSFDQLDSSAQFDALKREASSM